MAWRNLSIAPIVSLKRFIKRLNTGFVAGFLSGWQGKAAISEAGVVYAD
jgi:hypothetical protein